MSDQGSESAALRAIAILTGLLYAVVLADAFLGGQLRLWVMAKIEQARRVPDRLPAFDPAVGDVLRRAREITEGGESGGGE